MSINLFLRIYCGNMSLRSWSTSVSTVSGYVLDDRATEIRSPAASRDFSSNLCVQTVSGTHPDSWPKGMEVLSPGVKRGRGVMLTTNPDLLPRSWMSRSYIFSPPASQNVLRGCIFTLSFPDNYC
jgi:hypothetical protein